MLPVPGKDELRDPIWKNEVESSRLKQSRRHTSERGGQIEGDVKGDRVVIIRILRRIRKTITKDMKGVGPAQGSWRGSRSKR